METVCFQEAVCAMVLVKCKQISDNSNRRCVVYLKASRKYDRTANLSPSGKCNPPPIGMQMGDVYVVGFITKIALRQICLKSLSYSETRSMVCFSDDKRRHLCHQKHHGAEDPQMYCNQSHLSL